MKKTIDYILLKESDEEKLSDSVKRFMGVGYQLYGNPYSVFWGLPGSRAGIDHFQAVAQYEKERG